MMERTALYLAKKTAVSTQTSVKILAYGYEIVLSTLITSAFILSIAFVMGEPLACLAFALSFVPIRVCAGGYHAKTFLGCNIVSGGMFALLLIVYRTGIIHFSNTVWQCALYASAAVILICAPHENKNQPMSAAKLQKTRKKLVVRLVMEVAIIQIFMRHGFRQVHIAVLSLCLIALLLIYSIIMEEIKNEDIVETN